MLRIYDLIDLIGQSKYVSTLYLTNGWILAGPDGSEGQTEDSICHPFWPLPT